eukprot:CAMPEP_0113678782 /NCGR_PEP_ID=MMETSP0038_2-20120614/10176_1 /TAXON_ID=2898 /ORGANISM="Cryptomonas paramecium" /LENGTH=238 /DNA_ID=CAMNT_0000596533 /DNA_START=239 /DNA_END=953 /DNA_ORIENTATION=- /assembly_acc=CAM_ASM_000170
MIQGRNGHASRSPEWWAAAAARRTPTRTPKGLFSSPSVDPPSQDDHRMEAAALDPPPSLAPGCEIECGFPHVHRRRQLSFTRGLTCTEPKLKLQHTILLHPFALYRRAILAAFALSHLLSVSADPSFLSLSHRPTCCIPSLVPRGGVLPSLALSSTRTAGTILTPSLEPLGGPSSTRSLASLVPLRQRQLQGPAGADERHQELVRAMPRHVTLLVAADDPAAACADAAARPIRVVAVL